VRIGALRFTQKDISGSTTGGKPLKSVAIDMRDKGFDPSEAIDVVRQANGNLVTLDHRRVVAALAAGLTYVPATVHDPSEPIDRGSAGGYKLLAPLVLTDRTYPRNAVPTTWGEAALFRAYNQRHRTDADAKFPLDGTTTVPSMTAAELEDLRTAFPDYGK
jgi:hypothetical protein